MEEIDDVDECVMDVEGSDSLDIDDVIAVIVFSFWFSSNSSSFTIRFDLIKWRFLLLADVVTAAADDVIIDVEQEDADDEDDSDDSNSYFAVNKSSSFVFLLLLINIGENG